MITGSVHFRPHLAASQMQRRPDLLRHCALLSKVSLLLTNCFNAPVRVDCRSHRLSVDPERYA